MSRASPDTESIERELAEIGEPPPSEDELALAEAATLDDAPELAGVARLVELAEPIAFDDLSELEAHRVWRRVEDRIAGAPAEGDGAREASSARPEPAGGGPRRLWYAAAGLAMAAAVLLVVLLPDPRDEEVAELGDMVRTRLRTLDDDKSDSERAAEVAAEYQRRLAQEQGG